MVETWNWNFHQPWIEKIKLSCSMAPDEFDQTFLERVAQVQDGLNLPCYTRCEPYSDETLQHLPRNLP
jgi:hypothetical protein